MSSTTSVVLVTYTLTPPSIPASMIAALALIRPSKEFNVETTGLARPDGHKVKNAKGPAGTTVTFNEYAAALAGIPQLPAGMRMPRWLAACIEGPPNGPGASRVSKTRHGVTGT